MQTRTYQKLFDYILGDLANIEVSVEKKPESHKEAFRLRKKKEIQEFFLMSDGESSPSESSLFTPKFRKALRDLKARHLEAALFDDSTTPLDEKAYTYPAIPSDEAIKDRFDNFEKVHFIFSEKDATKALQQFILYFKITLLVADMIEKNNEADNDVAYTHAYKLVIMFGDKADPKKLFTSFDKFLANNNFHEKRTPLHDALIYTLPVNVSKMPEIDLVQWRKIIHNTGPKACRIFAKAYDIQKKLDGRAPKDFREAFETAKLITYKRMDEDAELAELCMFYDVSESVFDKCLELKKKRKKSDKLPHASIDGKDIGKPGYHFVKLPINDPRAFILGQITDCCQSIGGHSEMCVVDGITRQNNGFYVLLKEKKKQGVLEKKVEVKESETSKSIGQHSPFYQDSDGTMQIDYKHFDIVGQGYAWLSVLGNLVIDSWENLRAAKEEKGGTVALQDDEVIVPMLSAFAQKVVEEKDSTVFRVCIGRGGKTPYFYYTKESEVNTIELMEEGSQYGDSASQSLIYCNEKIVDELFQKIMTEVSKNDGYKAAPDTDPEAIYTVRWKEECLINQEIVIAKPMVNLILEFLKKPGFKIDPYGDLGHLNRNTRGYSWIVLALMHHVGISTEENIQSFTSTMRSIINRNNGEEYQLSACYEIIQLYNADLLKDYFEHFIKTYFQDLGRLIWSDHKKALMLLKKENILTPRLVEIILKYENCHAERVSKAFVALHKANLLNDNINLIVNASEEARSLADAIIAVTKYQETKENSGLISQFRKACQENLYFTAQHLLVNKVLDAKELATILIDEKRPLHLAAERGNIDFVKLYLEFGMCVDEKSSAGCSPLNIVVRTLTTEDKRKTSNFYRLLNLEPKSLVSIQTPATLVKLVNYLLEQKADINSVDNEGISPLLASIKNSNFKVAARLLECKEIKIDKEKLLDSKYFNEQKIEKPKGKLTDESLRDLKSLETSKSIAKSLVVLHEAKLLNSSSIHFLFFDEETFSADSTRSTTINNLAGANILNEKMLNFIQKLRNQTTFQNFIKILHESKIDLTKLDIINIKDIEYADDWYWNSFILPIKTLLPLNLVTDETINILLHSTGAQAAKISKIFASKKDKFLASNLNLIEEFLLAFRYGAQQNFHLARYMLENKIIDINAIAKINDVDKNGDSLLMIALKNQQESIARFILNHNHIKINNNDTAAVTPLLLAIKHGYKNVVMEIIVKTGVKNLNRENKYGITPLIYAIMHQQHDIAMLLLGVSHAYVNTKNSPGYTPLHVAVSSGDAKMVTILLDSGADASIKDKAGKTPADSTKNAEILALLTPKFELSYVLEMKS